MTKEEKIQQDTADNQPEETPQDTDDRPIFNPEMVLEHHKSKKASRIGKAVILPKFIPVKKTGKVTRRVIVDTKSEPVKKK